MRNIEIDFVAGSHGNYLEFVLNKLMYGDLVHLSVPFDELGASHAKHGNLNYIEHRFFRCNHYFQYGGCTHENIISIQYTSDDLLSLMSVSLLRAGNAGIYDTDLHINTYNKLNTKSCRASTLEPLLTVYDTIQEYYTIKAAGWPNISSVEEFYQLPSHIQTECLEDFGYKPIIIDEDNPNIDRCTLREFFKFGFKKPNINGFMVELTKMEYHSNTNVYIFPFNAFYDMDKFTHHLCKIKDFFNLDFHNIDIIKLHTRFLELQIFRNLKIDTDCIIQDIIDGTDSTIPPLSIFQESYINAKLELHYNIEFQLKQPNYFQSTTQMRDYINEIQK